LSDPERRLLTSLLACGLFGYATVSCLIFYQRMRRRISEYKEPGHEGPRYWERVVHSPQYSLTMWLTGAIGVIGFAIASWQLVLSLLAILRAN
jgi:hypothetical protein